MSTCDHCDIQTDNFYPSGGDDLLCKTCFDKASRPQEDDETDEDFRSRHPFYKNEEYEPLKAFGLYLKVIKERHPTLYESAQSFYMLCKLKQKKQLEELEKLITDIQKTITDDEQ